MISVLDLIREHDLESLASFHSQLGAILDVLLSTSPPAAPPPSEYCELHQPFASPPAKPAAPTPKPKPVGTRPRIGAAERSELVRRCEAGEMLKDVAAELGIRAATAGVIVAKWRRDNEHG